MFFFFLLPKKHFVLGKINSASQYKDTELRLGWSCLLLYFQSKKKKKHTVKESRDHWTKKIKKNIVKLSSHTSH